MLRLQRLSFVANSMYAQGLQLAPHSSEQATVQVLVLRLWELPQDVIILAGYTTPYGAGQ